MQYIKKLNENYYIYAILVFVFLPLIFLPQLFDGKLIQHAYEIDNISGIDIFYRERSRHFHLPFFYFVNFLVKFTLIHADVFLDIITTIFLILFCIEVKKYSKLFFGLENKWSNLAALFAAIFPVWHILVSFDISLYLISFFFALFGFRKFTKKNKISIIVGLIFIFISFGTLSSLTFVIGLAFVYFLLSKSNNIYNFPLSKVIVVIAISFFYFFLRKYYFPPSGLYEDYNSVNLLMFKTNLTITKLIENIFNYSTYLLLFIWIAFLFVIHLIFKNLDHFSIKKLKLKDKYFYKYFKNYFLLIILSGFAIFPYLLSNKSSSILYLSDYYQRHAFLLAPVFGLFFSLVFRDLSKINSLPNNIDLKYYLTIFISINLFLLNYGSYRKIESHFFQKNLTQNLKSFGSIPVGDVKLIVKNMPTDLRDYEISYLFYKAYNIAGWWPVSYFHTKHDPRKLKDEYSNFYLLKDYKYGCTTRIYLENGPNKYQRIKQFYIFKYNKYYSIDKIEIKC